MCFLMALLAGCKQNANPTVPASPKPTEQPIVSTTIPVTEVVGTEQMYAKAQLLCEVESQEDAQALAELYGITLVEYRDGLACFYTEEDPREVIRRGKENGWPELTLNRVSTLF